MSNLLCPMPGTSEHHRGIRGGRRSRWPERRLPHHITDLTWRSAALIREVGGTLTHLRTTGGPDILDQHGSSAFTLRLSSSSPEIGASKQLSPRFELVFARPNIPAAGQRSDLRAPKRSSQHIEEWSSLSAAITMFGEPMPPGSQGRSRATTRRTFRVRD